MLDTEPDEVVIPPNADDSRIHRPAPADPAPDDFASANDRIEEFWRKYKGGRIHTSIVNIEEVDGESLRTFQDATVTTTGYRRYTFVAEVYKTRFSTDPDATGTATRGTDSTEPITAQFPQETAETVAISRALRFLGIKVQK